MSNTWLSSDMHEGHVNIGKFRRIPQEFLDAGRDSTHANTLWLDHWWRKLVKPRDIVQCLGDVAFTEEGVNSIAARPGRKHMKGGNHDDLPVTSYMRAFEDIRGCEKKYGVWLSHFPMHPDELRGKFCVHGHTHYHEIDDWRYINICCDNLMENIGRPFISLEELRQVMENRRKVEKVVWLK